MPARRLLHGAGSMTNLPNAPTIHDLPAHSNLSAEPFLKGMHTLARGCHGTWLPRVTDCPHGRAA